MRKVLLATTALVAMGGVTAANADISISGNYEWEYETNDTGSHSTGDYNMKIKAVNTADNGMTFSAIFNLGGASGHSGATATTAPQDSYIKVEDDFGTLYLGDVEGNSAASLMDGALGRNKDIETQGGLGVTDTAISSGHSSIIYMTPKMGGFQLGLSANLTDTDASTTDGQSEAAITYSLAGINLYAGSTSGRVLNETNFGVSTTFAGITIGVGAQSEGGTSQAKSNDLGVNYTLANGIKLAALSANGTASDGTTKQKASNFGISYPLVAGVKLNAENGKLDDESYTWVAVNMSF
jgi:hypothetical protein